MSVTAVKDEYFKLTTRYGLKWFRSSNKAQRGFCKECGSVLFLRKDSGNFISIAAGSIDGKLGVPLEGHIFCASAGDYYEIAGGNYRVEKLPMGTADKI